MIELLRSDGDGVQSADRSRPRTTVRRGALRLTRVGLWSLAFLLLVAIAATNTGNNALYMVLAMLISVLSLSVVSARLDLRGIEVEPITTDEVFANRPFELPLRVRNRGRLLPRWLVQISFEPSSDGVTLAYLPRRGGDSRPLEATHPLLLRRRGVHRLRSAWLSTLFPFGLFRAGRRVEAECEILVYPELFSSARLETEVQSRHGEQPTPRRGWGHELHGLRPLRPGDDPRGIHWKQTARTGDLIFQERQAEDSRRVVVVLDNGVGPLDDRQREERFERLVSEAATAAIDLLERGWEVGLLTRDVELPSRAGRQQRRTLLEALARLEVRPADGETLRGGDGPELRFVLERESAAAPSAVGGRR